MKCNEDKKVKLFKKFHLATVLVVHYGYQPRRKLEILGKDAKRFASLLKTPRAMGAC